MQDKLKLPREEGKKGSKKKISWDDEDQKAFDLIKARLCGTLKLQRVKPDQPFVLRVDASTFAIGATLEQAADGEGVPTIDDVLEKKTVPVAFMSRKLASNQRNWVPRELETYAIISALLKWETWIGMQPVIILTDHRALEGWQKEILDAPSGPVGRRMRWHHYLSKFDLTVKYIPGKDNTIPDILSRWAYPASQAARDISIHGNEQDELEMKQIIEDEKREEEKCMCILDTTPGADHLGVLGVTTRSGLTTQDGEADLETGQRPASGSWDENPLRGVVAGPPPPDSKGDEEEERPSATAPPGGVDDLDIFSDSDFGEGEDDFEEAEHMLEEGALDRNPTLPSPNQLRRRVTFQNPLEIPDSSQVPEASLSAPSEHLLSPTSSSPLMGGGTPDPCQSRR